MAYITFFLYWDNGMSWLNRGYEFSLMWGLVCIAISLRGGGPFSLDRLMRRELYASPPQPLARPSSVPSHIQPLVNPLPPGRPRPFKPYIGKPSRRETVVQYV